MSKKQIFQKIMIISILGVSIILLSIFLVIKTTGNSKKSMIAENNNTVNQLPDFNTQSASISIGKSVDTAQKEFENATIVNNTIPDTKTKIEPKNEVKNDNANNQLIIPKKNETKKNTSKEKNSTITNKKAVKKIEKNAEKKDDVKFDIPVEGKIIREFAKDSLVYSNTLGEWITHNGVDIKSEKTSVVKSVADGKIYAIKNDPRYGLTIIIDHNDGFRSIYSNLLTTEFVKEGENVKKGQSIGTVGDSATFEISDESHLHFELQKDNEYVDPNIYIKFE